MIADAWRARAGFRTAAREWRRCVEGLPKYHTPGSKAYALEKADMFDRMAADVERRLQRSHRQYLDMMGKKSASPEEHALFRAFVSLQKDIKITEDRLDYSLVGGWMLHGFITLAHCANSARLAFAGPWGQCQVEGGLGCCCLTSEYPGMLNDVVLLER